MEEKRKSKRLPVRISLVVEHLYKQDHVQLKAVNESIEVNDISKSGIGFLCKGEMPLGYYFNARIAIDDEKYFYSVLKIIRKEVLEENWHYGCEFVGLADVLSGCIDEYEKELC